MFAYLRSIIPSDQLIVIHSHLPEVEWEGSIDHIKKYLYSHRLEICTARKTFFEMVEHRQQWPSPKNRQCTSDLKRGPLEKLVRGISRETGVKLIVNCMGIRAEESSGRARKASFKLNEGNSKAGREWYDWLPIHDWSEERVFQAIDEAGEIPFWTYAEGMKRKSCSFCIMACKSDLLIASRLRPDLYKRYLDTERRIGHTLMMPGKSGRQFLNEYLK